MSSEIASQFLGLYRPQFLYLYGERVGMRRFGRSFSPTSVMYDLGETREINTQWTGFCEHGESTLCRVHSYIFYNNKDIISGLGIWGVEGTKKLASLCDLMIECWTCGVEFSYSHFLIFLFFFHIYFPIPGPLSSISFEIFWVYDWSWTMLYSIIAMNN